MAEDDIYGNQKRYENFISRLDKLTEKPDKKYKGQYKRYYCKNAENLVYFKKLINTFQAKDLSYIRRLRMFQMLKVVTFVIEKNLGECDRDDINSLVAFGHTRNKTIASKRDFIKDLKCIWRVLFPEKDQKGRIDETITPYAVRHLSRKIDKSKEKLRNDRLNWEEFQKILLFFAEDPQIQAYLMLAVESLGRPQEILYTRIKDYEFHDNFAKIWISEHGKEGAGMLQCIDAYPFVMEWYNQHPFKSDQQSFFFINRGNRNKYQQLKNFNINKRLKHACKALGIDKTITCYSLKRNGVTFRRQRGDSDMQIQHAARWTSTKQLQIYDQSTQEDALKLELQKRGMIDAKEEETFNSKVKTCMFCSYDNGFTSEFCTNCKRPLDRKKIEEMAVTHERMMNSEMLQKLDKMEQIFETMKAG